MPTLHKPGDAAWNNPTSPFGPRVHPVTGARSFHSGMDYGWGDGWNVYAALDGVVERAYYGNDYNQGWGGRIVIDHGNGIKTAYAHLNAKSNRGIRAGHRVSRGQAIAWIGNPTTGASTGSHLHFELYIDGNRVNPYPYFTQNVPRVAGGSGGGETANIAAGQRKAGPDGVKRRSQPSSQAPEAGEMLAPGTVGNFVGWIRGESVDGNNIWYQGISGHFFWSGGFEGGANTAGLKDLNPVQVAANQRVVGPEGVSRRIGAPNTNAAKGQSLDPGTVGNFTHWVIGEKVDGNDLWYVGTSGDFFWSGGFTTVSKDGLQEMATALKPNQRKVKSDDSVNGRNAPTTKGSTVDQTLAPGTVADFKGYVIGEEVEGNAFWLVGAYEGKYFWSGAFEGGANMAGLSKLETPTAGGDSGGSTPVVIPPQSGAKKITPVYPGAKEGWDTPRGREAREKNPATGKLAITGFAIHHTASTGDNLSYFKQSGQGSVPNYYIDTDGSVYEMVRPGLRSVATASQNNWTVSVELQNSGDASKGWPVSDASLRALEKLIAWVASYNGKKLDGIDVSYEITPESTKGHKDWPGNTTECPGPYVYPRVPAIRAAAKALLNPEQPKPQPDGDGESVEVDRSWLEKLIEDAQRILGKK